jgi:DNA mismatch repair protein MutS
VQPGPASQSYGLQVAQLAGVPQPVIRAARRHLADLEAHSVQSSAQFDLFAMPAQADDMHETPADVPEIDALAQALEEIEPDTMTPREALDALYRLKALARQADE